MPTDQRLVVKGGERHKARLLRLQTRQTVFQQLALVLVEGVEVRVRVLRELSHHAQVAMNGHLDVCTDISSATRHTRFQRHAFPSLPTKLRQMHALMSAQCLCS